ncbi:hypothetical protein Tco_0541125 [Tanacetum coccineum]
MVTLPDFSGFSGTSLIGLLLRLQWNEPYRLVGQASGLRLNITGRQRVLKKGRHFFALLDKNLFRAASFPFRLCTSLMVLGHLRLVKAWNFVRLPYFFQFDSQTLYLLTFDKWLLHFSNQMAFFYSRTLLSEHGKLFCAHLLSPSEFDGSLFDVHSPSSVCLFDHHRVRYPCLVPCSLSIHAFLNSSTSFVAAALRYDAIPFFFCCTGVIFLFSFSLCSVTNISSLIFNIHRIPVISKYCHTNTSALFQSRLINSCFTFGSCLPMVIVCFEYFSFIMTFSSRLKYSKIWSGSSWSDSFNLFACSHLFISWYSDMMTHGPVSDWYKTIEFMVEGIMPSFAIAILSMWDPTLNRSLLPVKDGD